MKNYFPAQNQNYSYLQTNRSNVLGSIWSSMNLDLQSNLGVLRVAPRLKLNTSSADDADLGCPIGFKYFGGKLWTVAGTRVFQSSDGNQPNSAFTEDNSTNAQTDYSSDVSDIEFFNGLLVATTTDGLFSLDNASGGTWTARGGGLSSGLPHIMTTFKKFERLYYSNSQTTIYSINTSWSEATSGDYSLNLTTSGGVVITSIKSASNSIWIGTLARTGKTQQGKIYQWDGISAQVTNEYILDAQGCLALVIDNDIPYAMDSNGTLLQFTGSSFDEIGRLPLNNALLTNINSANNDRFIHPNGLIVTKNNTILALINNLHEDSGSTISENMPSGVWEFDKNYGFTHKYSFSYNPVGSSTITDYGQNRISRVGGLANVNFPSTNANRNGTIMLGATYYTNASSTASGIFIDDSNNTVQKKGYFVTTWFNSAEIQDKWTRLWAVYRRFLNANDSILFKYRLYEEDPIEASITWTSTTTFTTSTDVTAYAPTGTDLYGGEVEVIQGTGSASCAHITNVTNNAGTYTVTLDTAITGVTNGTAKARFQKWIKLLPEIMGQVKSFEQLSIGGSNTRIQIKGCMTFTGNDEFHKMAIFSNEDIKINA